MRRCEGWVDRRVTEVPGVPVREPGTGIGLAGVEALWLDWLGV